MCELIACVCVVVWENLSDITLSLRSQKKMKNQVAKTGLLLPNMYDDPSSISVILLKPQCLIDAFPAHITLRKNNLENYALLWSEALLIQFVIRYWLLKCSRSDPVPSHHHQNREESWLRDINKKIFSQWNPREDDGARVWMPGQDFYLAHVIRL